MPCVDHGVVLQAAAPPCHQRRVTLCSGDTAASPRLQGADPWQDWELSPNVQDPALVIQKGVFMLL